MFFDFSSAFNTIQPLILNDKLKKMGVDSTFISWIYDYLTGRPQFVKLGDSVSGTVVCNDGAPQGTVLAPFLFTLYTTDFNYKSDTCHVQKYSDDTAIMVCVRNGQEEEYRNFCAWSEENCLILNTTKTKEMVVNFGRSKLPLQPVNAAGADIEVVQTYKYLGVHLDNKLDWSVNSDSLYKKGQSRLFFLRRLKSFNVCSDMLHMFYNTVVASVIFQVLIGGTAPHIPFGESAPRGHEHRILPILLVLAVSSPSSAPLLSPPIPQPSGYSSFSLSCPHPPPPPISLKKGFGPKRCLFPSLHRCCCTR
ncbi:uncharacterized protein LOC129698391 isoform X1 [Leucoraja erinacea]|uniref:uncharacterized protein LOC129698391 isoform X1 n=1 Tax=Leucoraja erinaceus TaxID=7782 RepID=UPI002454BD56|nr:uncharacterized protein LOC129698391 isoform X1 [Leucoraja erinacea]